MTRLEKALAKITSAERILLKRYFCSEAIINLDEEGRMPTLSAEAHSTHLAQNQGDELELTLRYVYRAGFSAGETAGDRAGYRRAQKDSVTTLRPRNPS